jgi:hypothetical protein
MSKLKITLAVLLLLLPSAQVASAKDNDKNKSASPPYQTRVYLRSQCLINPNPNARPGAHTEAKAGPHAEFVGALAAIFLPVLIEKLLGGAGAALKKAGSEETLRDSGKLPTYLYQLSKEGDKNSLSINPNLGCLLVVRGRFNGVAPDTSTDEGQRIKKLRDSNIPVNEIAALYEAEIILSEDRTALRYEGRFFEVNQFQGGRSSKQRAVVVGITIAGAGDKEGEPVLSLALTNIGEATPGTTMNDEQLKGKHSSWLGGLAISETSMKAIETIKFPSKDFPGPTLEVMPVTIEATFAETDSGNSALKFIGEVLDATKGDVSKTISGEITKDRGAEAEKKASEAADALEKLRQEEETAFSALLKAESEQANADPLPANATPAQKAAYEAAQKVLKFEVEKAGRAWCVKTQALKNMGKAPDRGRECP